MENLQEEWAFLNKLMNMLGQHFGNDCEIVLHDLTKEYEHTIVDIRNSHVTGRKIGDCGSNLGLEVLRGTVKDGDRYNYITHTKDNRILRSSTTYIRNDTGQIIGALCINQNITESVKFEKYLNNMNQYDIRQKEDSEVFVNNVNELLDNFLQEGQNLVGKPSAIMNKDEKMTFLKYLDEKGVFLITKSGERVCEFLNISKFTLYNYLEALRNNCCSEGNK